MKKYLLAGCLFFILCCFPAAVNFAANEAVIAAGKTVKLQYVLKSDGKVVDSSKRNKPLEFIFGQFPVVPGFAKNILGMKAGEKKKFEIIPEDGFGVWDPQKTQVFQRSQIPDIDLKPGLVLTATPADSEEMLTGRVTKIIGDEVGIDFNHPLAGKTLQVEVKVIEVR